MSQKYKNKPRKYFIGSEILIPFLLLFLFVGINLYVGTHIGCYAIIFLRDDSFLLALAIGLFLYSHFSKYIDDYYIKKVHWKKPVFFIFYYVIYVIGYYLAYSHHLYVINYKDNTLLLTEYGAAVSFTYRIYPAYIFLQIFTKIVCFLFKALADTKLCKKIIGNAKKSKTLQ